MYGVPQAGLTVIAVAGPVERGVSEVIDPSPQITPKKHWDTANGSCTSYRSAPATSAPTRRRPRIAKKCLVDQSLKWCFLRGVTSVHCWRRVFHCGTVVEGSMPFRVECDSLI
jgi:hypothetical protein